MTLPRMGLGCMNLSHAYGVAPSAEEGLAVLRAARELGVGMLDTATLYGGGRNEELVGRALRAMPGWRDEIVLASKGGMALENGVKVIDGRPETLRGQVDASLTRLGVDRIDLYYLHRPDSTVPLAETVAAMQGLIDDGKIGHWGVSNFSAGQLAELLAVCDAGGWTRPVAVQPAYSLLKREAEAEMLPLCAREALAVVPYQVLQGGLLTGKYNAAMVPANSRLAARPEWLGRVDATLFVTLAELTADANAKGRTLTAHALLELLAAPAVTSLIVGATRPQQLHDLVAILDTTS